MAEKDTIQIKVSRYNKAYLLTIEPLSETVIKPKRGHMPKKQGIQLLTKDCPNCGGVEMNGICLANVCKPKLQQ